MKKMADAKGNFRNAALLYHTSVNYSWRIMVISGDYFFVDEAGLCSQGYTKYRWNKITPSEAVVMKKADIAWGKMYDNRQEGKMWG